MFILKNAEELNNLFIRNKEMNVLLREQDRKTLYDLIDKLSKDNCSDIFLTFLALQENNCSIEIIWQLHIKQIIDFTEFVTCYKLDVDNIVKALLFISESNDELSQKILTELLASLFILLSGEPNHKFDKHLRIIQRFLIQSCSIIIKKNDAWKYLKNLKCSPLIIKSTVHKIFKVMLKNMLMVDVDFHLDNAYEQYRSYKTPEPVSDMLKMFLDEIDDDITIYSLIHSVLSQHLEKANWKIILSLISTFVKTKSLQCHALKLKLEELFNQTLSSSTATKDFLMCKATLLIFRHCCLEIGLWSEYSRWYSSYKPNVDTAKVFYSLLTKLLLDDLPAALASHLNAQPKLTESCIDIQNEYVKKAQAQLIKINNGQDFMGLFKDYDDSQNRHEADIVKVLESFKSTGQVMRVVLEAFVFRNKYFIGTFLKTLMNTQSVDDQLRNSFIEKLNSMNKIPKSMYNKWKQEQRSIYFS
ncbi:Hypothetical protein CINCED_3A017688 [Cinara cedri]|uniref:Fanconi anaemia group A protein helical domain-containing protein n=1 Tax=Cinara cedri TaxID=506608 RepID=A0A5E4NJ40_9HEMI|nr:Hypothetical protein CINCED_3A017688 [Cinara cedri]